mgnify:CR=1 FL=1
MVKLTRGWISLSRKIQESFIWDDKPFAKGQAWIDLLLSVNHEDKKVLLGNELIMCKRGSTITSVRKLAERWGWSNTKTVNFLNLLESDEMIEHKKDTKKTVISIVKYDDYQTSENTKKTTKRHENDTTKTRERTNNNINNDNNINNKPSHSVLAYEKRYQDDSFEVKCVKYLINSVTSELPNAKVPNTDKSIDDWCDHVERMKRLDQHSETDIWSTILYATTDNFWKSNIRSTKKFREKYETLFLQSKNKKNNKQQAQTTNKFNKFPQRVYSQDDYSSLEQKLLNRS